MGIISTYKIEHVIDKIASGNEFIPVKFLVADPGQCYCDRNSLITGYILSSMIVSYSPAN